MNSIQKLTNKWKPDLDFDSVEKEGYFIAEDN
jgi:hypothetical protein